MSVGRSGNGTIMEEEASEYCVATYIRQNSANFERLNSLTESVCHSEEERKLMDKKPHKCSCNKTEYCSSECKEANRNCKYSSFQKPTTQTSRSKAINFHRQLSAPPYGSKYSEKSNLFDKNKKDVKIDMTPISSSSSIDSSLSKSNFLSVCKKIGIVLLIVIVTIGLTCVVFKFVLKQNAAVSAENSTQFQYDVKSSEVKQKQYATGFNVTSTWVSLNLDQKRFKKGDEYLRWRADEETSEISLTENDCLELKRSALYEIVSKITFEIWPDSNSTSIYHNVQLGNKKKRILDKNVITLLPQKYRHKRMLETSLVLVLREFQAGDVVCVNVQDTNLIYESPIDNSLKVIQKI